MTIEELPDSGSLRPGTGSQWSTTLSTLGAGIAIGVVLMLAVGPQAVPAPSPTPAESANVARASPSARPSSRPAGLVSTAITPDSRRSVNVDGVLLNFKVPADGWRRLGSTYIGKSTNDSPGDEAMIFWASYPFGQYAEPCLRLDEEGTTAADLAAALATNVPGTELVAGPTAVTVGGLAAEQVVLFVSADVGCGPGFFYEWLGEMARSGPTWSGPPLADTISIWVVDAGGERFIIAAESHLNAGAELEAEVRQIVASIEFEPGLADLPPAIRTAEALTPGVRHAVSTDGVSFTYTVPAANWARYDELYVSKDTFGSQTAEAMVLWARYPDGRLAQACDWSGDRPDGSTAASLATSLSTEVPGTELVSGPTEVMVGGVAATRVVLSVRDQRSCGLGYFLTWRSAAGGPFWNGPAAGDTITIWVLDLGESPFVIVAETQVGASARLEDEAQSIVDSIEFFE